MFIRQTRTNNKSTGESYFTHRLVRTERVGTRVLQRTVLNLGAHFAIKQADWPLLCSRIEQLLSPQQDLASAACSATVERAAQRCVAQLVQRADTVPEPAPVSVADGGGSVAAPAAASSEGASFTSVDLNSLQITQPRSVGVEHVALHAFAQLGLIDKLRELGLNGPMRAAILGNIVGRMAAPASELATWQWLQSHSALGELLDVDFSGQSHMRLYRASDALMQHHQALEEQVFSAAQNLFGLGSSVALYDLTNTYFEGTAAANPKAKRGRSKEKRSDCPLLTLGLVLDGSGFVRRSRTFDGNASEGATLQQMLSGLGAPPGALVIMDAGISCQSNLDWLRANGYRYLVVRRGSSRGFDPKKEAQSITTASGQTVQLQKTLSEDGQEVLLYCHSLAREAKEEAMSARFEGAYVTGLQKISDGLQTPRGTKDHARLLLRVGRLQQKSRGASAHYELHWSLDEQGQNVTALQWERQALPQTIATCPGQYCLRSSETDWDAESLWRTYAQLTDIESVFRSLKSELGLRPVFHAKEERCDGHLFITVLAYQCVQVLRVRLKAAGIHDSWASLRETLAVQTRVSTSLRCQDASTVHIRKSSTPEPELARIYAALGINPLPGGTKKLHH